MTYTPRTFTKGGKTEVAETVEEDVQLLWEGWTPGAERVTPRTALPAHLSDLDALSATFAPVSLANRLGVLNDKKNRRMFHDDGDLANWNQTPGTGTITTAPDSPAEKGGKVITLATGGAATSMNIETNAYAQPYTLGAQYRTPSHRPWVATTEMSITSGKWAVLDIFEGGTNMATWTIGLSGNSVTTQIIGEGAAVPHTVPNFSVANPFRISTVFDPTTGKVRFYIYYTDTVAAKSAHLFLGERTMTNGTTRKPGQIRVKPATNQAGVTVTVARTRVYEIFGVINGCSVDGAYNAWVSNPNQLSTTQNETGNTALCLARRMNDGRDWFVNHSMGGYRVDQMLAEFADFVLALKPRLVSIGSATNSLAAAVALSGTARSDYITQAKADYLSMVNQAIAAGCVVVTRTCDPRHDAVFALQADRLLFEQWNTWLRATMKPLNVAVADSYAAIGDTTDPTQLASWADAGDHVHLNMRAIQTKADIEYHALHSLAATS